MRGPAGARLLPAPDSSGCGAPVSGDVVDLARRVIDGEYGNGEARKAALGSNRAAAQRRMNEMLS